MGFCTGARRCLSRQATGRQATFRLTDTPRTRKGPWHVLLHRRAAMPPGLPRQATGRQEARHYQRRPPPTPLRERRMSAEFTLVRFACSSQANRNTRTILRSPGSPGSVLCRLARRDTGHSSTALDAAAHAHLRCLRRNSLKSWLQCVKIIKHTHGIRFAHTRVVCVNENCVLVFVSLKTHATTPQHHEKL